MSRSDPARLSAADVLAAVGELDCARAARAYATLGYPVVPMHTPALAAVAPAPIPPAARQASTRGWPAGPDWPPTHPAVVGEWWRRWPNANLGLVTGRRFDVLDLDGEWGVGALRAAVQVAPWEHPGPVARSGSGGWHLLYAPPGWATASGCCRGWTGGAAVGWSWRHPPGTPAAAGTPGSGP